MGKTFGLLAPNSLHLFARRVPFLKPVALPEPELGIRRQEVENDDLASQ